MTAKYLISVVSLLVLIFLSGSARAFECPKHFHAAQAAIDKVTEDMEGMTDQMRGMDMGSVHAVLARAKELLLEATRLHQLATAPVDHARSIGNADGARGYALGADILHFKMMKIMTKKE
jgi:hypothetical protein